VPIWLWSERVGVFSHETALGLHELSDVLPARIHLTLPAKWRRRRLRVPKGVVVHHADVDRRERV
jgi:predicted transcriptional regulator of viral defense system